MERHKRLTDGDERGGIGARSSLLAQHHDRKEAEDANGYEDGFHDTSRDKAEGEDFVYPLGDGPQHDGRADVGDDEDQLQERAKGHARVGAGTDDVVASPALSYSVTLRPINHLLSAAGTPRPVLRLMAACPLHYGFQRTYS